jgi:hypothetical protein
VSTAFERVDALVNKRAAERAEANAAAARYREWQRQQNRQAWVEHFQRLAASHARLAAGFEAKALALLEEPDPR